jgi:3-oxoacyl-[acyl-carrier-protein] synthase III
MPNAAAVRFLYWNLSVSRPLMVKSPEERMSDEKLKRGQPDRSLINMSEDYEVKYWTKHLGVSREELQRAVDKVGNSAATVRKELGATAAHEADFRSSVGRTIT